MTTVEYITKPGDRWDLIAYKAYGTIDTVTLDDGSSINAMSLLINTNNDIPADDVLLEGLLLQIPVIANANVQTEKDLLPPWK